jgi:hypothetical protein
MEQPSALYQLVESKLGGGTLADYVAARRATTSWRAMAADLSQRTGLTVSHETLRLWFQETAVTP